MARVLQSHPQISPADEQCGGCRKTIPAGDRYVRLTLSVIEDPDAQDTCLACLDRLKEAMETSGRRLEERG